MADPDRAEEQVPPAQVLKTLGRGRDLQELGLGDEFPHHHITCRGAGGVPEGDRQGQEFSVREGLPDDLVLGRGGGLDLGPGKRRERRRLRRHALGHHSPPGDPGSTARSAEIPPGAG